MQIAIVTLGTRGDVQPYVALGLGLKRAGHQVTLVTHRLFEAFVAGYGLECAPLSVAPLAALAGGQRSLGLTAAGVNLRSFQTILRAMTPLAQQLALECWSACRDADVVMCSILGALMGSHVAEKLGTPFYPAYLQNVIRTSAYPSMLAPPLPLGRAYNWLSYSLTDHLFWQFIRPLTNHIRQEVFGLPPQPQQFPMEQLWRERQPHLYGFSPAVVPKPPEWGDWVHLTGYWFLERPSDWKPPPALMDFLEAGPPPVSIGFGSLQIGDPEATTALVVEALARARQRGLLLTGWGGLRSVTLPETVFAIESAPHDWLFPRMAAVVHHGGAGTTAAGLRAGVPSLIVPHFTDQPFWAQRVERLGVGPKPIPRRALSSERLAAAIDRAVHDPLMRARAAALGRRLQAEDGVGRAVEVFQSRPARPITSRPPSRRFFVPHSARRAQTH
jgi:UDP:flavonoid glycosyltransferase YjiC (YdhE family)